MRGEGGMGKRGRCVGEGGGGGGGLTCFFPASLCVCVCVCVCERERKRTLHHKCHSSTLQLSHILAPIKAHSPLPSSATYLYHCTFDLEPPRIPITATALTVAGHGA